MAIDTRSSLCATANRQRVEAVVVGAVRFSMEKSAAEIGKSLTGSVTTLALENRLVGVRVYCALIRCDLGDRRGRLRGCFGQARFCASLEADTTWGKEPQSSKQRREQP